MRHQGREDELLARLCSNNSPRSLSVAAVTGMYGGNSLGKALEDCFWDTAAARTPDQKTDRPEVTKGRISLSFTHAVGGQAVELVNALGLFDGQLTEEKWHFQIDTPDGWRRHQRLLKQALIAAEDDHASVIAILDIDHDERDGTLRCIEGSKEAETIPVAVLVRRVLGSYGKYGNPKKSPLIRDLCRKPSPFFEVEEWYDSHSSGKDRRTDFIRALTRPWIGQRFTGWGTFATPATAAPVSTLRDIQEVLAELGHYRGPVDGSFGPKSQTALRAWSQAAKIPFEDCFAEGLVLALPRQMLSVEAKAMGCVTGTMEWQAEQAA